MSTVGEECFHVHRIHNYFDEGYDLIFDAHIEHFCRHFKQRVIPAERCGESCPAFQSLRGNTRSISAKDTNTNTAAHDARVRIYLKRQMHNIVGEIEVNATYLELQQVIRERLWREAEQWLSRQFTQPQTLAESLAKAEQDRAVAQDKLQQIERRLAQIKQKQGRAEALEQLWLEQENLKRRLQGARKAEQAARGAMEERQMKEIESDNLFLRWEDAVERAPLLKRLRTEFTRLAESWLEAQPLHVPDADIDRLFHFFHIIRRHSTDDVSISKLRTYVEKLSRS